MPSASALTPPVSPSIAHATSQTESSHPANTATTRIQTENTTLGKIGAALNKIKTVAIEPGLAALSAGLNTVRNWTCTHPTVALIVGAALAIVSIVGMATGGPAGIIFGGMGLAAGGYLIAKSLPAAIKKWKNEAPQSTASAAEPPSEPSNSHSPLAAGAPALHKESATQPVELGAESRQSAPGTSSRSEPAHGATLASTCIIEELATEEATSRNTTTQRN